MACCHWLVGAPTWLWKSHFSAKSNATQPNSLRLRLRVRSLVLLGRIEIETDWSIDRVCMCITIPVLQICCVHLRLLGQWGHRGQLLHLEESSPSICQHIECSSNTQYSIHCVVDDFISFCCMRSNLYNYTSTRHIIVNRSVWSGPNNWVLELIDSRSCHLGLCK